MGRRATGSVVELASGLAARVRVAGKRPLFALHPSVTRDDADARALALSGVSRALAVAGHTEAVERVLSLGAAAAPGKAWAAFLVAVDVMVATKPSAASVSLSALADDWFDGKLAERHPDHVKAKRSAKDDRQRFDAFLRAPLGELPVDAIALEHCDRAMQKIPSDLRPGTRRQIGQVLARLLAMAVYPCRLRESSPIPKGWLPRAPNDTIKECLYPDEDATLLACPKVDLMRRVLYGFLCREGMRASEALALRWSDLDLERGIVALDRNKTDEPRDWALSHGVARAFAAWVPDPLDRDGLVFPGIESTSLADQLRRDLQAAGVSRAALFDQTGRRLMLRAHDLRATFITLSLAAGRSEAWISDRTGHASSQMINRYRRRARKFAEREMLTLRPLDEALGLANTVNVLANASPPAPERGSSSSSKQANRGERTMQERTFNPSVPGSSPGRPTNHWPNVGQNGEAAPPLPPLARTRPDTLAPLVADLERWELGATGTRGES